MRARPGLFFRSCSTCFTAWATVEWCRRKASPISPRLRSVTSRARYMETWRANTMSRWRCLLIRRRAGTPNSIAVAAMRSPIGVRFRRPLGSASSRLSTAGVGNSEVSVRAAATTRFTTPSSSETVPLTVVAIRVAMSSGISAPAAAAFCRTRASRVSQPGRWTSAASPLSRRLRRRLSRFSIAPGWQWTVSTICRPRSASESRAWRNSWVLRPKVWSPEMNWMSSTRRTSTPAYHSRRSKSRFRIAACTTCRVKASPLSATIRNSGLCAASRTRMAFSRWVLPRPASP